MRTIPLHGVIPILFDKKVLCHEFRFKKRRLIEWILNQPPFLWFLPARVDAAEAVDRIFNLLYIS